MNAKEAFRVHYSKDADLVELSEENRDFMIESIGARHRWTAFESGWKARDIEIEKLKEQLWVSRISGKLLQDTTPAS